MRISYLVTLMILSSCSSGGGLILETLPEEASVYSASQQLLGKTPLELDSDALAKLRSEAKSSDEVFLSLRKEGYQTLEVFVEPRSYDKIRLELDTLGPQAFQEKVLKDYFAESHLMVSRFLKAQGYLGARQLEPASQLVQDILKDYPEVASSHVLAGDLAFQKGDRKTARDHFLKANQLAPNDAEIKRALAKVGVTP